MTELEQLTLNEQYSVRKKMMFVADLAAGGEIEDYFFLEELERQSKKAGGFFHSGKLRDRTGVVAAKIWEGGELAEEWVGRYVKVRATAKKYRDKIELHVSKIRILAPPETVDVADFTPVGPFDRFMMMNSLAVIVENDVRDSALKGLCRAVIDDPGLHALFRDAPAAKSNHQCYVGGLLEHVLSLIGLAVSVARHYEVLNHDAELQGLMRGREMSEPISRDIDRDILIAACIFHDIGKTRELRTSPSVGYTAEGSLIGHVGIGMEMLDRLAPVFWANLPEGADVEVYQDKWLHLRHIVASHHGQLEWRAIATPMTREAHLFHLLDMIDSRVGGLFNIIEREKQDEDGFYPWNGALGGRAWKPKE